MLWWRARLAGGARAGAARVKGGAAARVWERRWESGVTVPFCDILTAFIVVRCQCLGGCEFPHTALSSVLRKPCTDHSAVTAVGCMRNGSPVIMVLWS